MRRVLGRLQHGALHLGFRSWAEEVRLQAEREHSMRRIVGRMKHEQLRRGWRSWAATVLLLREQAAAAERRRLLD